MEYLESDFFLIALTFGVYFLAKRLQARTGWLVLNPILLAILALIGFLKVTGISYETYAGSASIIDLAQTGHCGFGCAFVSATQEYPTATDAGVGFPVGRLFCRHCFGGIDCQMDGSLR